VARRRKRPEDSVPSATDSPAPGTDHGETQSRIEDTRDPLDSAPPAREEDKALVELSEDEIKKLADEYGEELESQLSARSNLEESWLRWDELYRARPSTLHKSYPWVGSSNVVVAVAAIFTDQIVARIMQAIFAMEPHWVVQQLNRAWAGHAKPLERYMDWARDHIWNQYKAVKSFVLETVKLGTAILYTGYKDEWCYRYDEASGQTVTAGHKLGPDPRWIPLQDYVQPVGYPTPDSAPYCAMRDRMSGERLQALEHAGYFENVKKLKDLHDPATRLANQRRAAPADKGTEDQSRFGLFDIWTVFFARDLDGDGYPEQYVMTMHLATRTVLRLRANPYVSGMRPFVVGKFVEIEGEFYGQGVPEMVEHLQEEISTIHNQRRDNAHLANIRMYKARAASNLPDTIRPVSGKVIKLLDVNDLEPFAIGDNRQADIYEENTVMSLARERVGMTDVNQGNATSPLGRAAATTVMALLQEGSRRFDLNASELRMALSEEGAQIVELWQTHGLPEPGDHGSPEQVLDPEDAQKVREIVAQPDDVRGLVSLRLNVATAAVNREVEKQSIVQLYGTISQYMQQLFQVLPVMTNPMIPQPAKEAVVKQIQGLDTLLNRMFQAFGTFDLDTVLVGDVYAALAATPMAPPLPALAGPAGQGQEGAQANPLFGINPAALVEATSGNGR
jgi:hypothetical protein